MKLTSTTNFAHYFLTKSAVSLTSDNRGSMNPDQATALTLQQLWQASDISASQFADEVATFYRLPRISLATLTAAKQVTKQFSRRFLRECLALPYEVTPGQFRLAVADPSDPAAPRAAELIFGTPVELDVGSFEDLSIALDQHLGADHEGRSSDAKSEPSHANDDDLDGLRDLASGAPVVRAVNDLIEQAVELRASDIHIEPFRTRLSVRMRVDGLLRDIAPPTNAPHAALLSRIKILAGLNIAERRLPQDGAARMRVARDEIDIRVATMPTQNGESAVIRLLPRDRGLLEIGKLGLAPHDERTLRKMLDLPHGMIIVTGPTGSGKTTTLATMLSALNKSTRKILTIEDPVEYEIAGVNQSQVKPAIGLTFAAAMRAFVRQDPDVIMVGEVRDAETAHIAVQAALTGHLVLTTLHTETATAAVPRLIDLGVESFMLKSVLRAVVGQRLVRLLCKPCRIERRLTDDDLVLEPRFELCGLKAGDTVWEPQGCERCAGFGYRGRRGVFEVLEVTRDIRRALAADVDADRLDDVAREGGMTMMIDDAIAKCRAGDTSVAEVLRVTTAR